MPDRLFLGVDGGQSSTTALIANEQGEVLGRGVGGPCNHASAAEGRRKFLSAVEGCLQQACQQAGLAMDTISFSAACFGLSGGFEDKASYIYELVRSQHFHLTHDGEIALTGATAGAPGVIIIAGTGSFAFGKNAEGEVARSGGWGYIYGDEGGAFDIARQALRAALRYEEGWGAPTSLRTMLLEATDASSANELLHRFYADTPRSRVAALAPLITQAAEAGDEVADSILDTAAGHLCRYVYGVQQQLFDAGADARISYIGGVFESPRLLDLFTRKVKEEVSAHVAAPVYEPVVGAVLESFRLVGLNPASEFAFAGGKTS